MRAIPRAFAVFAALAFVGTPVAGRPVPSAPAGAGLLAATRAGARRFVLVQAAVTAGYAPQQMAGPIVHYVNQGYLAHGHLLDPQRPEALVYEAAPGGMRLVAVVFMLHRVGAPPPVGAGLPGLWHIHATCYGRGGLGVPTPGGSCPADTQPVTTPEMLHVWLPDVRGGPYGANRTAPLYHCDVAPPLTAA